MDAEHSKLATDAMGFPVQGALYPSDAIDISATDSADTVSADMATAFSITTGEYILIEIVADGDLRYMFGEAPEVSGSTGSRLPDGAGAIRKIKRTDKISVIGESGSVTLNVTHLT